MNSALDIEIIERHLYLKFYETNLEDLLNEIAVKLNNYEQKINDLKHQLEEKDKILARNLGLV